MASFEVSEEDLQWIAAANLPPLACYSVPDSTPRGSTSRTAPPGGCKKRVRGEGAAMAEVARSTAAAAESTSKRPKTAAQASEAIWKQPTAKHGSLAPVTRRQTKLRARLGKLRDVLAAMDAAAPVKPADRKKVKNKRYRTRKSMVAQHKRMVKAGCWYAADQEAWKSHMAEGERRRTANHRRRGPG